MIKIMKRWILLVVIVIIALISPAFAAPTISISPVNQTAAVGNAFYVGVSINSDGTPVQFAHVEFDFPAAYATAVTITYNNLMGGYVAVEPGSGTSSGHVTYGVALTSGNATAVNGMFFTVQMYASGIANVTVPINITNVDIMNDSVNHLDPATFTLSNGSVNVTPGVSSTVNVGGFGSFGQQRYLHYVQFIPQRLNGTRYQGIYANFTATDTNGTVLTGNGTTGSDGTVGFEMTQNLSYYIQFTNASLGVNTAITIYPVSDVYTVCIDTNCTSAFTTGTVNATLTNYTTNYTNKSWSIQNLTSANLNSTIGLGMTGQGILTGIVLWFVVGAGGAVTGIVAGVILALMGLITWVMLLFVVMTGISVYVLRGWLG